MKIQSEMSRKRKAENVAQYLSQEGCDGLRRFVSHATLNLDLSGCDELARERIGSIFSNISISRTDSNGTCRVQNIA